MDDSMREVLSLLAYIYLQNEKYDKALNLLQALKKVSPNDQFINRSLAYAQLQKGNFQEALLSAEQSMRDPSLPENLKIASALIKSKALMGLGREEAARHAIQQLIKL